MSFNKFDPRFTAVLKTPEGKLLEQGYACVSQENGSVDFQSDFVPLFKMGTPLMVVQVQNGMEVHRFFGDVYLSSGRLLRLVRVRDEVLPEARLALTFDVSLSCTVTATISEPPARFHLLHRRAPAPAPSCFEGHIHSLSMQQIKLTCAQAFTQGQKLLLDVQEPAFSGLSAEVEQVLDFGQEIFNYRCRFLSLPQETQRALEEYLGQLSSQTSIFS